MCLHAAKDYYHYIFVSRNKANTFLLCSLVYFFFFKETNLKVGKILEIVLCLLFLQYRNCLFIILTFHSEYIVEILSKVNSIKTEP